jgi:putative flippase GtrA
MTGGAGTVATLWPVLIDDVLHRRLGHRPLVAKWMKYGTASAAGVVVGQSVLIFCLVVADLDAITSNVIAVTAGSVPNYLINRAWTFNKRGAHSFTREVLPFWLMAVLGLVLSTIAVAVVDERVDGNVIAISLTNIAAFGVLWFAKFVVLDRYLFAPLAAVVEGVDDSPHKEADARPHS